MVDAGIRGGVLAVSVNRDLAADALVAVQRSTFIGHRWHPRIVFMDLRRAVTSIGRSVAGVGDGMTSIRKA